MKYILGIESTAHTFGAGIVSNKGEILSNVIDTFKPKEGGFKPADAANHHYYLAKSIITNALKSAKLEMKDISLISYSASPGLGAPLEAGASIARFLSSKYKKPIIGVNHCIAHIEIGKLKTNLKDPLVIFASGANTQIIAYMKPKYRIYGETTDIGIGNALDQFGRALNIPFPAGPTLDKMYFKANKYIDMPYTVKGMDLSFSGILTFAKNKVKDTEKNNLTYSYMHTLFAMLTEVIERALSYSKKKELLVVGGVGASKALGEMLGKMCKDREIDFASAPLDVVGDNGAMIAYQGYLEYYKGKNKGEISKRVNPYERLDEVDINYI